ncbi:MAG: tRNA (N6-threonylcarbamoyladenosine(37)-N6)-methyltransferase TrmO [Syntrophobacteraceae bacterium CG2_30_61_12]|nr:MAG: tRNA (N6-threonylcarbamoyladenosine(37)-N6)-methyltransferase TrmO [Syntrophobacteraceae bacterium CG2_30_61_12]PIU30610.1 MAG: tRNA (N6-threonylcarbamoyladenosine(37)-N6)-methyltransferase TrmO [Syntrophobacteraceae bacterium CG07_land_8_20_14_0_80_61_8]
MQVTMTPIGYIHTDCAEIPRHWTISRVEGELVIEPAYQQGLRDIQPGDRLMVLFWFHRSRPFTSDLLLRKPPHLDQRKGVFSTCSPRRPNPLGHSIVEVLARTDNRLWVRGLDMVDGTPILDLKPVFLPDPV